MAKQVQVREKYREGDLNLIALHSITNRFLSMDRGSFDIWDDYGCAYLEFSGYRDETDAEQKKRIAADKKVRESKAAAKAKAEEAERAELQRLIAKYGDGTKGWDRNEV